MDLRKLRNPVPIALIGFAILCIAGPAFAILVCGSDSSAGTKPCQGLCATKVYDGDTIALSDGRDVRLIGIDTPETVDPDKPVMCGGEDAHAYLEGLVLGKPVRLELGAEAVDDYDRTLAYVYIGDRMINKRIARKGYARYMTIAPNDKYAPTFERLVYAAMDKGQNLWACPNAEAWATGQAPAP